MQSPASAHPECQSDHLRGIWPEKGRASLSCVVIPLCSLRGNGDSQRSRVRTRGSRLYRWSYLSLELWVKLEDTWAQGCSKLTQREWSTAGTRFSTQDTHIPCDLQWVLQHRSNDNQSFSLRLTVRKLVKSRPYYLFPMEIQWTHYKRLSWNSDFFISNLNFTAMHSCSRERIYLVEHRNAYVPCIFFFVTDTELHQMCRFITVLIIQTCSDAC